MKFLAKIPEKSGSAIDSTAGELFAEGLGKCRSENPGEDVEVGNVQSSQTSGHYLVTMTSSYKSKTKLTLTWILALFACLWLCVIFFLLPSETRENVVEWDGWMDAGPPEKEGSNRRPIIGILAQEYYFDDHKSKVQGVGNDQQEIINTSYIAASYVKFIEGAGARVVPILINNNFNETYLRRIFQSVNGIFFPGGAVDFDTSKFGAAGRFLRKLAIQANDEGIYFPLWGTCLGFEFLLYTAAGSRELRTDCGAWNVTDRLKFTDDASKSRLFGKAGRSVIAALGTKEVTANFHNFCITQENFTKFDLYRDYRVLSVNYDSSSKLTYISSVEARKYPFYAVQFHPEKNLYEWTLKENIPHSKDAIGIAQYFANFIVSEAKKNTQSFETEQEELSNLIYNFRPEFTGANGSSFEQLYMFPM